MSLQQNTEVVHSDTNEKTEWQYFDENAKPVHLSKVVYKNQPRIIVYPYSYSKTRGVVRKKVHTIELKGWARISDVPTPLRIRDTVKLTAGSTKRLMSFLYKKFPEFEKLVIEKSGNTRFSKKTISFKYDDLNAILKAISKETRSYETRRKTIIANSLSKITSKIDARKSKLVKGDVSHYFGLYSSDASLSDEDISALFALLAGTPGGNISVTRNFIQAKDKINVAYLDDVIESFETLFEKKSDNEKDWQNFFERHGWILANLFPFQVVLRNREAYVGGKTIENKDGRVVDFLFQNGFKDNYALLEIKTHNKCLIKATPYRKPDTYALHEDLSGAISQCLDQKNAFLTDMGQSYRSFDPKTILVCGTKSRLSESQARCFELMRSNQKHVEITTFDELLAKIKGLRDLLNA